MAKEKCEIKCFKSLVAKLTEVEGGKEEVNVAQMNEVIARLRVLISENPVAVLKVLLK